MNIERYTKDAIDFEEIKRQKESCEVDVLVNEEWLEAHPRSFDSKAKIAAANEKIAALDILLEKEPPLPELPPCQPLVKISGVLEEVETLFARGYFSDQEYAPEEFARQQQSQQWGSVLLAMIGNSTAAAINSTEKVRPVCTYDFVQGKINGVRFYGWLGLTTAKVGDYVELAAIEKPEHYEVYALTIPELRVISIIPYCYQGVHSRAKTEFLRCYFFSLLFLPLLLIVNHL